MDSSKPMNLLDLPEEILETIFSYLPYHETSEARLVCRIFNKHCQTRLNKGFSRVDKLHAQIQKEVKNKLPRRESERRNHPLARHVDILSAIETRLSLLGMSYLKYIDSGLCCFIPGKVLDELVCILRTLQSSNQPPRSHEFLQELRDISSMAMEHFDEKIAPGLKAKFPAVTLSYPFSADACACPMDPQPGTSTSVLLPFQAPTMRGPSMRSEINSINGQLRTQSTTVLQIRKDVTETKIGYANQKKKLLDQEKKIIQQGQVIGELEEKVNDLNKKFIDLSAELMKLKEVKESSAEAPQKLSCLHTEEYSKIETSRTEDQTESSDRLTRNKGIKRKVAGTSESRVKKSKQ